MFGKTWYHKPPAKLDVVIDDRPLLDRMDERTSLMVANLKSEKARIENDIIDLTEKLRQVNVVLQGAEIMLDTIKEGYREEPPVDFANDSFRIELEKAIACDLKGIE